ncbi:MAG: PEGA domain-containing protein [Xanthobacteraceae bacterium]
MSRVELIVAATAAVMGIALGGCSGSMPQWMSSTSQPAGPQMHALRFESDPPGAEVRTVKGETCQTPCALTVPTENQSVSFAKEGFEPQTVQVIAREPADQSYFSSMFSSPPRTLAPNPVQVVMISVPPPPPPPPKTKHHKSVSRARTAAKMTPPPAPPPITSSKPVAQPASAPFPPPSPQPASSPFPAPPQQPESSPFPPPPPTH